LKTMERTFRIPLKVPSKGVKSRSPKARMRPQGWVLPNGVGWRFFGGFGSDFSKRILSLRTRERRRLESTWLAIAGALEVISPGLTKGIRLRPRAYERTFSGIMRLYRWVLKSWVFQGEDWLMTRLSSLSDWALYYAVESDYSHPEIVGGLLGETRDGWLTFPWAKGVLDGKLIPSRGPHAGERPDPEKNAFHLYSLYSLKGALPTPSKKKVISSLEKHRDTLTSGGTTPRCVLEAARGFMKSYRRNFPPEYSSPHLTVNSSAIYERPRSQGGRGSWIVDQVKGTLELMKEISTRQKVLPPPGGFPDEFAGLRQGDVGTYNGLGESWKPFGSRTLQNRYYSLTLAKKFTILTLLDQACEEGWVPRPKGELIEGGPYSGSYKAPPESNLEGFVATPYEVRPSVVEEQGFKARVITISPGVVTTLLHLVRTYCYSSLAKDPEVGTISGEGTLVSFMKRVSRFLKDKPPEFLEKRVLMSLDLSRATDTFHADLCRELLDGFLEDPATPRVVKILAPLANSPLRILYEDLDDEGPFLTNRGIPMGNPSSWFLLNSFCRFHWELAGYLAARFPKKPVEWIVRNLRDGGISGINLKASMGDPMSSGCGDDRISLTKKRRALIFEAILPLSGAIISPGVHLRSDTFGVYTKQLCILERSKMRVRFVDILRSRSLSTPDSRLPGKKEVPPSWSRGVAASRELAWWHGSVYQGASTFVWWRYHEFIERCITLGLEPWLPRKFGGLEFPHYLRKLEFISPKTPRMLSILLRADYNLENLLSLESLSGIWNPRLSGNLGAAVSKIVEEVTLSIGSDNLEKLFKEFIEFSDPTGKPVEPPVYPSFWSLRETTDRLKDLGYLTLREFLSDLRGEISGLLSWQIEPPGIEKVPSLGSVARSFRKTREAILKRDPYQYKVLRSESFEEICKRMDWKTQVVFIRADPREVVKELIFRPYSKDPSDRRFLVRGSPSGITSGLRPFFVKG